MLVPNLSSYRHNHYLFKQELAETKKRRYVKRVQVKQGPLVPTHKEVDEADVKPMYIFSIQRGEFRTSTYPVIHYSKLHSVQKDVDEYYDCLDRYYFTLRKLKKGNRWSLGNRYDSDYFDVYRPGGRIVTLNGDKFHALDIYNKFMENRAASYTERKQKET